VFIRAGPAHYTPAAADTRTLTTEVGRRLTAAVDALRDEVGAGQLADYRALLHGRPGVDRIFDTARGLLPHLNRKDRKEDIF
jgi:hypothetical protein